MAALRTVDEIAAACGCSPGLISRMRGKKNMPREFASAEEALGWYTMHRERRPREDRSGNRVVSTTNIFPALTGAELEMQPGEDFESRVVGQAEAAVLRAYALLQQAQIAGADAIIDTRLSTWADTAKQAAAVRTAFQASQIASRRMIAMDEVEYVVGAVIRTIAADIVRLADRIAVAANPAQPELARAVIAAESDRVLLRASGAVDRIRGELQAGKPLPLAADARLEEGAENDS